MEPLHLQRVITLLLLLIFWGKITRSYKLHISVFITIIVYKKNIMLLYLLTVTLGIDLIALGLHQTRL